MLTAAATLRNRGESVFDHLAAVTCAIARGQSPPEVITLPIVR